MKAGVGIEGIWGKDRGKHGVKVEGSNSEDRVKQRAEVNRYERAIFIKKHRAKHLWYDYFH